MSAEHEHSVESTSRPRISDMAGRQYWRSLDELADTPAFQEFLHREFPEAASEWNGDGVSRRNFLSLMGASLALAGVSGCIGQPEEKIVPYIQQPEQLVPGKPLYYATAFPFRGYGLGVLVENHMGRPTKIEGNPLHPASLGATNAQAQASILTMYDPDRAQVARNVGQVSTWSAFITAFAPQLARLRETRGQGLRLLTQTITSPTLAAQIQRLLSEFPEAQWHCYDPLGRDNERAGAMAAFGQDAHTIYRFERADVVLSLDADFLQTSAANVRYARDFIDRRRVRPRSSAERPATSDESPDANSSLSAQHSALSMNRLYVVESTPSITGTMADHRRSARASEISALAGEIYAALSGADASEWATAVAADLLAHKGKGIVIAGDLQPAPVHALAHAMNALLGNLGQTIVHTDPIDANPADGIESLRQLVADMNAGAVDTLVILEGNPVYDAPADLKFVDALERVPLRIAQSLYYDETAFHCHWHIPRSHWLEAWSDIRAFDGAATIMQPLILPLYQTKSAHELLAAMLGDENASGHSLVRAHWEKALAGAGDFETLWQKALHDGIVPLTAAPLKNVAMNEGAVVAGQGSVDASSGSGIEIIFKPDPSVMDGRYANNGWLQELPKPITKLTWDNAALVSPATARKYGWENQRLLKLSRDGATIQAPVLIVPGHPDDALTVHLGYGRERSGRVGTKTATSGGANAYLLRTSDSPAFAANINVASTGVRYPLAITQEHHMMEGRDIVRVQPIEQLLHMAQSSEKKEPIHLSLYPEYNYTDRYPNQHAWGMTIDMTACVGCNACVVACQAENNIPIVGKTEVVRGREMHWIRIDTYYRGEPDQPEGPYFQPMLCQHCESAPCEVVCPVAATTHSSEGLNEMTYNRCVGTRYCSNNCPYKVRRFNFLQYADNNTPSLALQRNPDVTVRDRGVMEKCTYCVQRINQTRVEMKVLRARAADAPTDAEKASLISQADALLGELQTACQQACPTQAIIFGDLNQGRNTGKPSAVELTRAEPHNYGVLTELNTRPRTTYLARITNPNGQFASEAAALHHGDEH